MLKLQTAIKNNGYLHQGMKKLLKSFGTNAGRQAKSYAETQINSFFKEFHYVDLVLLINQV